jgi:type II secretory pathway component PulM
MRRELKIRISRLWFNLQYREQVALCLCALAVLAFVAYVAIARPLVEHRDATARQLIQEESRFERILSLLAQFEDSPKAKADMANAARQDLRGALLAVAQTHEITIDRIQGSAEGFTLTLNNAAAQTVFDWLAAIERELKVEPSQLTLRKNTSPNGLTAQVSFRNLNEERN